MVDCDFQGPEFRGSAAVSARTAPHAFFLFRSDTHEADPLVRSLNHGLTYLFPRAISAVVLAKVITASASGIIHVLLTVSRTAYREPGRKGDRRRSSIAGSIISHKRDNTHVRLSFRKRERFSAVFCV